MAGPERKLLPTHIRPADYSIRLEPDFEKQLFVGFVEIRSVESPSSPILALLLMSGKLPGCRADSEYPAALQVHRHHRCGYSMRWLALGRARHAQV